MFNVYGLGTSPGLGGDTLAMVRAFKASRAQGGVPLILAASTSAIVDRIINAVEHTLTFLSAANAVLPSTVIVSLVYRLMVLYSAFRILPRLKNKTGVLDAEKKTSDRAGVVGTPDVDTDTDSSMRPVAPRVPAAATASATDELSEAILHAKEPDSVAVNAKNAEAEKESARALAAAAAAAAAAAKRTRRRRKETEPRGTLYRVLVLYSRFVLIAVYSHLLLLDQNHQVYWQILTVVFTLALWSVELLLGTEDVVPTSVYE